MAKRTLNTQYERYMREYNKRLARTVKYGLKVTSQMFTKREFELEAMILRGYKVKDIAATVAKEQTAPLTGPQVQNLMNNAIVNGDWNDELKSILNTLGLTGKYDALLNDRSHNRTLRLTKMMTEVYAEMKRYLEVHPGEFEVLTELIGEAFWGS